MTKAPKRTPRSRERGPQKAPKLTAPKIQKKTLSPRVPLEIYERLQTEARITPGLSPTKLAEQILTERYSPFVEDLE